MRQIPSVDAVAREISRLDAEIPRVITIRAARAELELLRVAVAHGAPTLSERSLAEAGLERARLVLHDAPRPVVNATGVIIHTNLGRAPLSDLAVDAVAKAAVGYSDLEYDVDLGARRPRSEHISEIVREVVGADAALVVNNNAAAVFLALEAHARGREVLVARGESIAIGGGFRIPDILSASGASLRDVGTTNHTRLQDYADAISDRTAAVLRVHRSNFAQIGFTSAPDRRRLADLAHAKGLVFIEDLGSGTLIDTSKYGLDREPLVGEALQGGSDVVTFSGDKMLGGPQAGLLVGATDMIDSIAKRPIARALRPDKMTIAGLRATFLAYLRGDASNTIPVWQMISASEDALRLRAHRLVQDVRDVCVVDSLSTVGGGALPAQMLPSIAIRIGPSHGSVEVVAQRLRSKSRPVISRIHNDSVYLDMRTVLTRDEDVLATVLRSL